MSDVVRTIGRGGGLARAPLLVLDRLEAFLDEQGLGDGPLRAERIGPGGGSNFSFLLVRGEERYVLRRPPRPPLPPSAHDMVREARLQLALAPQGIRLPPILAVCEDESILGVAFYVMAYLDGHVVTDELPAGLTSPAARRRLGDELVDSLVEIHAADVSTPELAAFARPGSYLERQVRRFTQLWSVNATRELPVVVDVGRRLADELPEPLAETVVHGDYRLGNLMLRRDRPDRVEAVLDWEMGAIGDPRADLGYLLATYAEPGGAPSPLGVTPVTALEGSRPRRSSWLATPTEAPARSGRSGGSRRSRSGRRPSSARRSTGASSAVSSAPRTRAPRPSRQLCRSWRRPRQTRWSGRDRAPPTVGLDPPGFAEADWNERYTGRELVWTAEPNRLFAAEVADLPAGRALDLACGEGRNAVWLAERGWRVTGVDFAAVGLAKARDLAASRGVEVDWVHADLLEYEPEDGVFDLVAILYLQVPHDELDVVLRRAATAVARGGTLLVLGHDTTNLRDGHGGPKDVSVLFTPEEVVASLDGLVVERAEKVQRTVSLADGREAIAIDAFVRARRPIEPS